MHLQWRTSVSATFILSFAFPKFSVSSNFSFVLSVIKNGRSQVWVTAHTAVLAATCWRRVYQSGSQVRVCPSVLPLVWSSLFHLNLWSKCHAFFTVAICHVSPILTCVCSHLPKSAVESVSGLNVWCLLRASSPLCWFDHCIKVLCALK